MENVNEMERFHPLVYVFGVPPQDDASNDVRFEMACAECPTGENTSNQGAVKVQYPNRIPECEPVPRGVMSLSSGTTVEMITLERGFFRTSETSRDILECHRQSSCIGGNDATNYCAPGYEGPCEFDRRLETCPLKYIPEHSRCDVSHNTAMERQTVSACCLPVSYLFDSVGPLDEELTTP